MEIAVRDLGGDDVDALQLLLESDPGYSQRITGYPTGPSDALSVLIARPAGFDEADKFSLGLWADDQLVGFADLLKGYPDPETAWIGLLIVDPRQRRVGYGRALHAAIIDRASSWPGVRRILLGIVATNAAYAEPFWRALGYRPTGEVRPYRYDHVESTVARWELALGETGR